MAFAQTLRDIGRSTHRVETHSGFPIHIKRANGVPVVRGAAQPSLAEFSGFFGLSVADCVVVDPRMLCKVRKSL